MKINAYLAVATILIVFLIKCYFLTVSFIKYIFSEIFSINACYFSNYGIISIHNSKQNKLIPIIFMGILAETNSPDDKWHQMMPKPFLKVSHIIIPHDCRTAVTVALNVKGHLNTFRHWVYGESYSTDTVTLEQRKIGRSQNWNPPKPQVIMKSFNVLNFTPL